MIRNRGRHDYQKSSKGAGLAEPVVARELEAERLFRVEAAPMHDRSTYAVYPAEPGRTEALRRVLDQLPPASAATG